MTYHDRFTLDDLDALVARREGPCVSFFVPTTPLTRDAERDRIQLKNLRARAFEALTDDRGLRRPDAEAILAPVDEWLDDETFWRQLGEGLAVFVEPGAHRVFRLAERFEPRVAVGDRFVVKPLVPLLSAAGTYHLVALSRNAVRVLEGTRHGAHAIDVTGLPADMTDALGEEGARERASGRTWQGDEGQKLLYRKYFRQVDRALRPLYTGRPEPLVLAGVDYLLPIFRDVTGAAHVVPGGVEGNPDRLSASELHAKAWPLVEPQLDAPRRSALGQLAELRGTPRVTDDVSTILGAAHDGRVGALFVDQHRDLFGTFDRDTRETVVHGDGAEPGDVDLTSVAARWTLARGGDVFEATGHEALDGRPVAAIMRY